MNDSVSWGYVLVTLKLIDSIVWLLLIDFLLEFELLVQATEIHIKIMIFSNLPKIKFTLMLSFQLFM